MFDLHSPLLVNVAGRQVNLHTDTGIRLSWIQSLEEQNLYEKLRVPENPGSSHDGIMVPVLTLKEYNDHTSSKSAGAGNFKLAKVVADLNQGELNCCKTKKFDLLDSVEHYI